MSIGITEAAEASLAVTPLMQKQLQTLSSCHFIEHGENLVILGPPGVGKTHLAVGLGLKAIEHGYRVLFTTAATLITGLTRALIEGRLEDRLKVYAVPRLLIIDEIGYLPIDRAGEYGGDPERALSLAEMARRAAPDDPRVPTHSAGFSTGAVLFSEPSIS